MRISDYSSTHKEFATPLSVHSHLLVQFYLVCTLLIDAPLFVRTLTLRLEQAALSAHLGGARVELLPGNVSAPPGFHLFMPNQVCVNVILI